MFNKRISATFFLAGMLAFGAQASADETLVPKLQIGDDTFNLRFYGQFDPGVLFADDGRDGKWYAPVDNSNSSTRFGVFFHVGDPDGASVGANYEFEYDPYATKYVNQDNEGDPDWDRYLTRKAEVFVDTDFGKVWIGQGSMASDGTAEVDLSGTSVIGYSGVSDLAGGQLFAIKGDGLTDFKVSDVFKNYDGLSRKFRVRYDTPTLAGFTVSGSYGTEIFPERTDVDVWDVALRYAGEFGAIRVASAVAYSDKGDDNGVYDGSVSLLHVPTGLSLTGAAGYDERDGDDHGAYVYGKLGYQKAFFDVGKTAFSADIYSGDDIRVAGSDSFSWGLQAVQNFDYYQTQVYLGYREYEYDDRDGSYKPVRAVLTGARVKF
ncbi:MAG: porin [Bauldia sp.]|nr:porin [Bauldia sp.]